jgi:hypothetical protein
MGSTFYISEGIKHILDFQALDHMLFVVTLCCVYRFRDLKNTLILLTAFTLGHALTLTLSGLQLINLDRDLIETLIPITIIFTAIANIVGIGKSGKLIKLKYLGGAFFGLIHGAGFSNYFRLMLDGIEDSVITPLIFFTVGIELGQAIILFVYLLLSALLIQFTKTTISDITKVVSGIAIYESLCILFL